VYKEITIYCRRFLRAEKKVHNIVPAEPDKEKEGKVIHEAKPVGNATGLRAGAIILWVVAFIFEILAYLVLIGKINLNFMPTLWQLIVFLVLDLVCVIIGSQLWKKANRIRPASERNKVAFWLWNNLGMIVAAFAFIPFIILVLVNKDTDKQTKAVAVVVAIVALLVGGLLGYDFNPISYEQQQAAMNAIQQDVYWAPSGHVYHTHDDCQAITNSAQLTVGTVQQAIEAGRERLCAFCAKRDAIDTESILTDGDPGDVEVADSTEEAEEAVDTAA
jgi:hypothetical protein